MSIFLAFDLETTGLDFVKDRPIEVGIVLYSTGQKKCLESQGFLVKSDVPVKPEITKITGITQAAVDKYGYDSPSSLDVVLGLMRQADAIIGHNVVKFDRRMLQAWISREGFEAQWSEKLWVDTYTDLPGAAPGTLSHTAADHGFLNLFPHSALTDCLTCLKLFSSYDESKVIERAKSPMVVVHAHQDRSQNELAKKARFRWYPERKQWWRWLKEIDLETFAKDLAFDVSVQREGIEEYQDL
jgi:DNA polymerase III epsilon subunit-like protein